MIGIIAALEEELQAVLKHMTNVSVLKKAQMTFYTGNIGENKIALVRSGVGKVNAASCTQILIDLFDIEKVINVGVGGMLASDLNIGDIAISSESLQYDMDASIFGTPKGEIPNMGIAFFPADESLINIAKESADELGINSKVGRIMTADLGLSDKEIKDFLVKEYEGICCDMEGAAIAQVAYINNIPYLVIRSFSDNADTEANDSYTSNLVNSSDNVGNLINSMFQKLNIKDD